MIFVEPPRTISKEIGAVNPSAPLTNPTYQLGPRSEVLVMALNSKLNA